MSHTLGPWKSEDWRKPNERLPWRSTGNIWAKSEYEDYPGKLICSLNQDELRENIPELTEEFEANARLIAAAPELLHALKAILGELADIRVQLPAFLAMAALNASEIIKRAEGGK